jgi:hypothetical protein
MGQPIQIVSSTVVGDVLVIDTDRSVSGQDGAVFGSLDETQALDIFPARLARRLFEAMDGLTHVFAASNTVVIGRQGGWDGSTAAVAQDVVKRFFVFYGDDSAIEAATGA